MRLLYQANHVASIATWFFHNLYLLHNHSTHSLPSLDFPQSSYPKHPSSLPTVKYKPLHMERVFLFHCYPSQQSWYGTNHVIATMGSDFNYVDAHLNLKNIDKLIRHVNARVSLKKRKKITQLQ